MTGVCEDIQARLNDWLDDGLSPAEHEGVRAHLRGCAACREVFARFESLQKDLSLLAQAADRIAARPVARRSARRRRLTLVRVAAAVALAVGIASAAFVLRPSSDRELIVRDGLEPADGLQLVDADWNGQARAAGDSGFHLELAGADNRLAVRVKAENPRIHVVWLYGPPPAMESTDVEAEEETGPRSQGGSSPPVGKRRITSAAVIAAANL